MSHIQVWHRYTWITSVARCTISGQHPVHTLLHGVTPGQHLLQHNTQPGQHLSCREVYHQLDTTSPDEGLNTETKGRVKEMVWGTVRVRDYS